MMRFKSAAWVLCCACAMGGVFAGEAAPEAIDDEEIQLRFETEGERLMTAKKPTPSAELVKQLDRTSVVLELPAPAAAGEAQTLEKIYVTGKPAVLVLGMLFKCKECPKWHADPASAVVLRGDGICATNYHVFEADAETEAIVVQSSAGKVYPVMEVLAASKADDVLIFRIDTGGETLAALPLGTDAPVGASVAIISHPTDHFFALTNGLISRYAKYKLEDGGKSTAFYTTAEFAAGSSGGPVLNLRGEIVGLAAATESAYYEDDGVQQKDLQMVFKACVPVSRIKALLKQK